VVAALAAAALSALVPAAVSAHPLGNFTINHFAGIRVTPDGLALDVVIDQAEIPTFTERHRIDLDGDGQVSAAELEAERQVACGRLAGSIQLTVDGSPRTVAVAAAGLSFPPGAGGLSTMRLVCEYTAIAAGPLTATTTIRFADTSDQGRIGWREIALTGDRMTISGSDLGTTSVSGRLTHYPADLLSVPLATADVTFSAAPGGPPLGAPCIADAFLLSSAPTETTPGFGCGAGSAATPSSAPAAGLGSPDAVGSTGSAGSAGSAGAAGSAGSSGSLALGGAAAAVPGGVGSDVAGLLQTRDLTLPIVLVSILAAMVLGAAHAVTPGHGKTIMAAYLVGTRGTPRHALALGLTVTASHTLGVLLLAVVILSVSRITPESFNHVAGIASGLLVVGIGGWLFVGQGLPLIRERLATWRTERAHAADHSAAHAAGAAHFHADDEPTHDHRHAAAGHDDGTSAVGWHEHGGRGHTHLPHDGATLTWRSLFALGLFGGLVPSINALIILLATLATGRAAFGLLLVIAFGAGMAIVLGGIGLGLVYASRRMARAESIPLRRLVAWAPAMTAVVILGVGLWVTGQAIWGSPVL
jgi:ABC-type nickel/cobalt efflux system permease component RcnA